LTTKFHSNSGNYRDFAARYCARLYRSGLEPSAGRLPRQKTKRRRRLRTVTHEQLVSKTGKLMPTVIAEPLTEAREEEMRKIARNEENQALEEIGNHPDSSQADIARQLGWLNTKREIQKAKVHRIVKELKKQKLVEETRAGLSLTEKGNKAVKAKHGAAK
jgi:hypothetical protein